MKRWTEEVCNGHLDLVRNDDGEYCLYEDYKALESKLGTCNKACADGLAMMAKQDAAMVELRSRLDTTGREVDALEKALFAANDSLRLERDVRVEIERRLGEAVALLRHWMPESELKLKGFDVERQ